MLSWMEKLKWILEHTVYMGYGQEDLKKAPDSHPLLCKLDVFGSGSLFWQFHYCSADVQKLLKLIFHIYVGQENMKKTPLK